MGLSWFGATSTLLVLAFVMYLVLPRKKSEDSMASIAAENYAADVCLDSLTGLDQEPLSHSSRVAAGATKTHEDESRSALAFSIGGGSVRRADQPENIQPTHSAEAEMFEVSEPEWKIKWGRVGIFGCAVLSLALAFITAVLALVSGASWVLPAGCVVLSCGSLVTLRMLALRDQAERAENSLAEALEEESLAEDSDDVFWVDELSESEHQLAEVLDFPTAEEEDSASTTMPLDHTLQRRRA